MLNLICGPSGVGKTKKITELIKQDILCKKKCYLLVPEQQAYVSEGDLLKKLPQNAGLYFEVVHFSGLSEEVFRQYGNLTKVQPSAGMKKLVMWDTLRTLSPHLSRYGKSSAQDTTLTSLMVRTVDELRTSGIDSQQLEEIAKRLPSASALSQKLTDLALIDAAFHQRLEDSFGQDPSDRLLRLARILREHSYFKECNVYVDSFTSFTAQEYSVLLEILRQADRLTVSLLTNAFVKPHPHFESTTETARRLQKMADQVGCDVTKELMTTDASNESKPLPLRILEADLWRFDANCDKNVSIDPNDTSVRLIRCANLYEEAEAAALCVLESVHSGVRYSDVAILVRDVESYRGVLDAALERYHIPYFLSERTDLSNMPLARLILSALRSVSRHYRLQDVMTLVKTGLAGVDVKNGALFEEYCETWHINGNRFLDGVWSMNPDGLTLQRSKRAEEVLEAANRTRQTIVKPLQALSAQLKASAKMVDRCRAIYEYLSTLHVSEQLSERAKAELASGEQRQASETVRVYSFFTKVLTDLCRIFPDTNLTVDEFISVLTVLFSESDIGSVPNLRDCVVIGSASTVRIENNKTCIVLGLCEGEFPRAVNDDGLLTEDDKAVLEEYNIRLDSREKIRSSEELLYVYRAFAKPSERLILSTVSHKTDGSELTPSLAFTRAAFLLGKEVEQFDIELIRQAQNNAKDVSDTLSPYVSTPLQEINLRLSQSKLQAFILCPYRYYCTYQLKLREKKDSRPTYADDGTFLHYIFEHFLKAVKERLAERQYPSEEEILSFAEALLNDYIAEVCPVPMESMDRRVLHLFDRLRNLGVIMLKDIVSELKSSCFIPSSFEQVIGFSGENGLPAIVFELKNGSKVSLSGMIDRIDLYEVDEKIYVRVVDYKSGMHEFSPEDVRSGLDIQLVLYLLAVVASNKAQIQPAGAEYLYAKTAKGITGVQRSGFLLNDPDLIQAADQTDDALYTKKLKKLSQEEMDGLFSDMKTAVESAAERMIRGEADKTPSEKACSFCPVRVHCDKAWHK